MARVIRAAHVGTAPSAVIAGRPLRRLLHISPQDIGDPTSLPLGDRMAKIFVGHHVEISCPLRPFRSDKVCKGEGDLRHHSSCS